MDSRRSVSSASPFEVQFGFCRGLKVGRSILVAGTAPIGEDGATVAVGDPAAQARRCFDIIKRTVEELGGRLEDVTRTRMFLTHIEDWPEIGAVHGEYFKDIQPVATMVGVAQLIDADWRVEIEAEAVLRE